MVVMKDVNWAAWKDFDLVDSKADLMGFGLVDSLVFARAATTAD